MQAWDRHWSIHSALNSPIVLCWALFGDTALNAEHSISLACTASGNATKAWQNLRHDKARLAIGLGCQSTKAKTMPISQQNTAPGSNQVEYRTADDFVLFFGPSCPARPNDHFSIQPRIACMPFFFKKAIGFYYRKQTICV